MIFEKTELGTLALTKEVLDWEDGGFFDTKASLKSVICESFSNGTTKLFPLYLEDILALEERKTDFSVPYTSIFRTFNDFKKLFCFIRTRNNKLEAFIPITVSPTLIDVNLNTMRTVSGSDLQIPEVSLVWNEYVYFGGIFRNCLKTVYEYVESSKIKNKTIVLVLIYGESGYCVKFSHNMNKNTFDDLYNKLANIWKVYNEIGNNNSDCDLWRYYSTFEMNNFNKVNKKNNPFIICNKKEGVVWDEVPDGTNLAGHIKKLGYSCVSDFLDENILMTYGFAGTMFPDARYTIWVGRQGKYTQGGKQYNAFVNYLENIDFPQIVKKVYGSMYVPHTDDYYESILLSLCFDIPALNHSYIHENEGFTENHILTLYAPEGHLTSLD